MFTGESGVSGNNSGFTGSNPVAPEGVQVGIFQMAGIATQSIYFTPGTYRLINYGGGLTNNGLGVGTTPVGFTASDFTIQTSVANQVNVVVGTSVLFWDGAQTVANNVVNGGSGDWNTTATNWTNASGERRDECRVE